MTPPPGPARSGGLARAAGGEEFSLSAAVGGPRGLAEAVLPGVVFVTVVTLTGRPVLAGALALAVSALAVVARLVARLPVAPALAGAVGVGVCALTAWRTGRAADFYVWGLLLNAGYGLVLAASTLPLPRVGPFPGGPVPVTGVLLGAARGDLLAWRRDPALVRLHRRLTWVWVGVFAARLAVQVPLYLAGAVTALGAARLAMGLPLFAGAAWVTWLVLRRSGAVRPARPSAPGAPGGPSRSRPR